MKILTFALSFVVLSTFGFSEVGHRAKFSTDGIVVVEFAILILETSFCLLLSCIFDIHIAHHMFSDVVSHKHIAYFSVFAQLHKNLLVEIFKMPRSIK